MAERIVVALGGNALGKTPEEQLALVKNTARPIVDLVERGCEVIIGHGNGPQVGMINLAMEYSANKGGGTPAMPFPECGAMTQGYIGYHLQQAIREELRTRGIDRECATVVTQVVVDENDPGFQNPTKPVGSFYTKEEAERIAREKGYVFVEDAGRGWRRVVPSPIPKRIVERRVVEQLVEAGDIVITVGGGGIPVAETGQGLRGVAAVIDKDRASARLALELNADRLIILTAVDRVCINYNKPGQRELSEMTLADCERYIAEGQFAPGSMLPKVESCMDFVRSARPGATALITSLSRAAEAMEGKTGTVVKRV
ncbi:MAG: carbamate kinase [Oscillospiraceae bacterium]|nr:carbamate kinase [Oscillospiraceae bacterium]